MGVVMMLEQKRCDGTMALLGLALALALGAKAQAHEAGREHRDATHSHRAIAHQAHEFRARDAHRFGRLEPAHWRAGHWSHRCYLGQCGWWWFADGQWFFYDRPVYPYPPVVAGVGLIAPAPAVMVAPSPAFLALPPRGAYAYN
jgi:hypothetical protein